MKNSRRDFLKLISAAPASGILLSVGCADVGGKGRKPKDRHSDVHEKDVGLTKDMSMDARDDNGDSSLDLGKGADMGDGSADIDQAAIDSSGDLSQTCELTGRDVEGPFHEDGAPLRNKLASKMEPGIKLQIQGRVVDENCKPIAGVTLDVWQADADGNYHGAGEEYRLRAQMKTDGEGRYAFETIQPGRYKLGGSFRPSHIHFIVSKPGYQPLTTQLYFEGDPYLSPNDPCGGGCNSGDSTLIIPLTQSDSTLEGRFEIVLKT